MKYKLLKDLPWIKAWEIIDNTKWKWSIGWSDKYLVFAKYMNWTTSVLDDYSDFFKPINERELIYPENLMEWYAVGVSDPTWITPNSSYKDKDVMKNTYILWLRFPTKEKAEAYIDLKRDVARFNMTWQETYFNEFYVNNEDWPYREEVDIWKSIYDKINVDFILPLDATDEEKENRVKLLKAYYWF